MHPQSITLQVSTRLKASSHLPRRCTGRTSPLSRRRWVLFILETARALNNLASLYQEEGKPEAAVPLYERSLAIYRKVFGEEDPGVALELANLASLSFEQKNWARAASLWQESTALIEHRSVPVVAIAEQGLTGKQKLQSSALFRGLIKAAYRSVEDPRLLPPDLIRSMFLKAQWSMQSEAAEAMAQMAARGTEGDAKLSSIIRDRQDLPFGVGSQECCSGCRLFEAS